ncbi:MAG: type VI secretion system accessory protein TagJ [Gemmataceae bacterium]
MNASELYRTGQLKPAIDAQLEDVRSHPADHAKRLFLFELLVFAGDLERAKKHIDLLEFDEIELKAAVQAYKLLLDSEIARRRLFSESLVPRFFGEQSESVKLRLQAVNFLRQDRQAEATDLLADLNQHTESLKGDIDGKPFQGLRDCDDLLAGILEVMAQGGYYWVPLEQIESIATVAPKFPRDLIWTSTRLELKDGSGGNVFLPILYPGSHEHADDQVKLGRLTDWKTSEQGPVLGVGAHMLLAGEEDKPLLECRLINFE